MSPNQPPSTCPTLAHVIPSQGTSTLDNVLELGTEIPWTLPENMHAKAPAKTWSNESLGARKLPDSARFFDAAQGQLPGFCVWPHPLVPRRPWIPTFFSPADPPCQKPLLCEKMTPCSASLKSVPRLFLVLPTSWLGLCTTLKCPEAKPIFPSDSLAGAASFSTSPPWWTLRFQKLLLSLNSSDSD